LGKFPFLPFFQLFDLIQCPRHHITHYSV